MVLLFASPLPSILSVPVSVKFSILLPNVYVIADWTVSVPSLAFSVTVSFRLSTT